MSARLFVAKLPLTTTEADLREYFSQVGPVTAVILPTDRETGKKRGFAFVDFAEKATADEAIRRFNNGMFKGQAISVSEARPREDRGVGARPGAPPPRGFSGRSRFAGAGSIPHRPGSHDDQGEERPSRRARIGKTKEGSRKKAGPKAPPGPIRERRSGRLLDLGDDHDPAEAEFDNFATSAPPGEDELEE